MANGIPTGGAPLFLGDFSKTAQGLGQHISQQIGKELQYRKVTESKQRERDLEALNEAMSFEAIEGLGKKAAMEHAKRLSDHEDKWKKIYYERGNKLTTEDYINLNRDTRQIEQDMANMKYNIAQVGRYQQWLKDSPDVWHPNSLNQLHDYIKEGNLGKDASHIMRPYFNFFEYARDKIDPDEFAEVGQPQFNEDGTFYTTTQSNREGLQRQLQGLMSDPNVAARMQDAYDAQNIMAQAQVIMNTVGRDKPVTKPTPSHIMKERAKEQMTPEDLALSKKYPGLTPELAANMEFNNNLATRLLKYDDTAIQTVIGSDPRIEGYKIRPDGTIVFFDRPYKDVDDPNKQTVYSIKPPTNWDNPTNVRMAMNSVFETLNLDVMTGKQVGPGRAKYIQPVDVEEITAKGVTDYERINEMLKDPDFDEDKIIEAIEILYGDTGKDVRVYRSKKGGNVIGFAEPGFFKRDTRFDLDTESGRRGMDEFLRQEFPELAKEASPFTPQQEEQEQQRGGQQGGQSAMPNKEDIIDMYPDGYEQAIKDMEAKGHKRADIEARLKKIGVTPDSWAKEETAPEETEEVAMTVSIPDSSRIAKVHNNPGNLMWAEQPGAERGEPKKGGGYWAKFKTPEEGFKQLQRQIDLDKGRNLTLSQFISKYAPPSENATANYLQFLIDQLGDVTAETLLADIDTVDLAKAVALKESSTKIA